MGVFDSAKVLNRQGTKRTTANNDILDMWGTIFGSPQFDSLRVVDMFGNLGKLAATGPWEVQKGTVETVGQDLSRNPSAYATPITMFASSGTTGFMDGVVSGAAAWILQAGPQTIGGVSYAGNGLIVSTAANNADGILTMQAGTNYQLGETTNSLTGSMRGVTLNTGATLNLYGGNTTSITKVFAVINNAGATINWKGPDVCGKGVMTNFQNYTNNGTTNIDDAIWTLTTSMSGSGVVNVLNGGTFANGGLSINGGGTFYLNGMGWKDASCVSQGALKFSGNTTFWNNIVVQTASKITVPANTATEFRGVVSGTNPLLLTNQGVNGNERIHFMNTGNTYSGTITADNVDITGNYTTSLQFAKINLINGGAIGSTSSQTIGSLAGDALARWNIADFTNVFIKNNGVTTYAGKLIWTGGSNTANVWLEGGASNVLTLTGTGNTVNLYARNGSKVILQGATFTGTNGQIRISNGSTISAGTTTTASAVLVYIDATSALDVRGGWRADGTGNGQINTGPGTSLLSAGWKVNLLDTMAAGTYVIWKNTGSPITQLPVIGTNLSGRTVTGFAWNNAVSPRTLSVTLI